jgi:predicted flap endonuclease-1-like 5' DNA nuclease
MTLILLVIVVVVAALAGYIVGSRTRPLARPVSAPAASIPARASAPATSMPPPVPAIDPAVEKPREEDPFAAEKARIIRSLEAEAALLRSGIVAREAPLAQLAEFAGERERLFRELGDERTETARYRQVLVDIERNAPPPILAGVGEPDDLKLIVGVGPVLERMLHNLGITTFRQIARWTERDVAEFDARLPEFPGRIQRDQWVTQARALHESKYGQSVPGIRAG